MRSCLPAGQRTKLQRDTCRCAAANRRDHVLSTQRCRWSWRRVSALTRRMSLLVEPILDHKATLVVHRADQSLCSTEKKREIIYFNVCRDCKSKGKSWEHTCRRRISRFVRAFSVSDAIAVWLVSLRFDRNSCLILVSAYSLESHKNNLLRILNRISCK